MSTATLDRPQAVSDPKLDPPAPSAPPMPPVASPSIFERAVCLSLTLSALGNRRKLNPGQIDVDADKELIAASKKLLDSMEYQAVKELDGQIRQYVYSRSLPSLFKSGTYLLPIALIEEVDAKLRDYAEQRANLVTNFIGVYPRLADEARGRLRSVYNPQDYKEVSDACLAFGFTWSYLTFSTPDALKRVSPELFQREAEKIRASMAEAQEDIRQLLRVQMADMVNHMVERLSGGGPDRDGKPKVFRNTLIENITDFLSTFDARNLTDDAELQRLVQDARKLLDGVDPDTLRKVADTRQAVATSMARIKEQMDTMLVDRPKRAISFDD